MAEIVRAEFRDALHIYKLIKKYPVEVLPRSLSDIASNIDRFFLYVDKDEIVGTAAFKILPIIGRESDFLVEIVSLCVDSDYHHKGAGSALTKAVIAHVKKFNPTKIILLTFSPDFFARLGFRKANKKKLHSKIYLGCINCTKYDSPFTCPEIAMTLVMKARRKRD